MVLEIYGYPIMSQKPYDFLASDKEPLLYLEKSILCMKDGFLTALAGEEGKKIISPSGTLVMMLGAGTSITQEAAIFSATNDMQIAFARGGSNIHSFFMSGRYQNPLSLVNQVNLSTNHKVEIAKKFLKLRLKILKQDKEQTLSEIDNYQSTQDLLLWEARWAKTIYKQYCLKRKVPINFVRNFNGTDIINERLNILNNALYSVCTAIILSCSLSPSIAFLHGYSRRGGLTFDLADIFKTKIIFDIAFSEEEMSTRKTMFMLANRLKENNYLLIKKNDLYLFIYSR